MKTENDRKMNLKGYIPRFLTHAVRAAIVILVFCIAYGGFTQKKIADGIVRLHIIANSDNAADQELKFKVRDAIIAHMHERYPVNASRDEIEEYLQNSLDEIRAVAQDVLKASGSNAEVSVRYGQYPFPTRNMGISRCPQGSTNPCGLSWARRKARTGGALCSRPFALPMAIPC